MFKLYIDSDGKAVISKETNATEADITISIGALTTWLLCYQTWSTLARFGKVSGKEDHLKRLQNRIQMQSTYLTDFF
jgi:predicted acetyltransferase